MVIVRKDLLKMQERDAKYNTYNSKGQLVCMTCGCLVEWAYNYEFDGDDASIVLAEITRDEYGEKILHGDWRCVKYMKHTIQDLQNQLQKLTKEKTNVSIC